MAMNSRESALDRLLAAIDAMGKQDADRSEADIRCWEDVWLARQAFNADVDAPGHAEVMMAIYDVSYHYGPVTVSVVGTHDTIDRIEVRGYPPFDLADGARRFVAWAKALRSRQANQPKPEPEPPKDSGQGATVRRT